MSFNKTPDFIAELKYLTKEEGGRSTTAFSGYRPHIKFSFSPMMTSGQQTFIGQDSVKPGETIMAEIAILSPQFFVKKLAVGMEFEVGEGAHVVAHGKLLEILNTDLIKRKRIRLQ